MAALASIDALGKKADPVRAKVAALPKVDPNAPERVRIVSNDQVDVEKFVLSVSRAAKQGVAG